MELDGVHMQRDADIVQLPIELEKRTREISENLQYSPAVQAIFREIDINDSLSLLSFGSETAKEISQFSDMILNSIKRTGIKEAGELMKLLAGIMDRFDLNDFNKKEKNTFFQKLFSKRKNSMETVFGKYESMQEEIEKVGIALKKFEKDILKENDQLENMFQHSLAYYAELKKFIAAGEMAVNNLTTEVLPDIEYKANVLGNQIEQMKLHKLQQSKELLEQRIYDLQLAENVALQSLPMIKMTQNGNDELVHKIGSSFFVTLPLFKQALAQTVAIKRSNAQAKANQAVDEKMNELLKSHADNEALQEKIRKRLTHGSFQSLETLEKSWGTIVHGIEDVKNIYRTANEQWSENTSKLERFKKKFEQRSS